MQTESTIKLMREYSVALLKTQQDGMSQILNICEKCVNGRVDGRSVETLAELCVFLHLC